ncbi:LysR family transcriptional regulator [Streptosporangium roseum]|uniref:Transcriptional regulator-like protein n=1 Tax=Streptosporangium roseum (strain ATCC 12428 / DSM 43021 / JCM 3005 / KCTC 9067 / NCIMB 10171 / NRRL 2505 / NI 9100) TaxID=479432 RepID=D2B085_STRRD|nr:LysR family transcriptional regulator [Streptosporangium roseum]ACZ89091.1 Transcriptional regulator-like protein [Streptosporangium roseum DSM 43021]
MELRDIEIFLTLAEELHFGRTAARLHVSPARISQAIQKQERQIGAPLFERNSHTVRLSPVGQQLRDDLRPLYAGLKDSMERAQLVGQGITGVLRVGMLPANAYDLRPYWDAFRLRHPQWKLRIQKIQFSDAFATLRRGDIDVLIAWLPIDEPDLIVGPVLFADPRVLAVSTGHELTRRTSVSLEIAADFQHPQSDTRPDYWYNAAIPRETRRGRTIERGPLVQDTEGAITLASMAEIVVLFPAHMTRYWIRPDITYLPVTDMGPLPYALVWRSETENELIRALAEVARDLGPLAQQS